MYVIFNWWDNRPRYRHNLLTAASSLLTHISYYKKSEKRYENITKVPTKVNKIKLVNTN